MLLPGFSITECDSRWLAMFIQTVLVPGGGRGIGSTMNNKNSWGELLARHLHGELDEAEKECLAELLDSNAVARQEFVEHVQWDTE